MKLRVIGCTGPYPGAGRPTSGYLLEAGGALIALDMGSGVLAAMTALTDPAGLDAVCISHTHWDHIADLLPYQYLLEKRQQVMDVFFPPEEADSGRLKLFGPAIRASFLPGEGSVAGVRVITVPTRHPLPNRAMRFEAEGHALVYTGDAADEGPLGDLCRGADILLADGAFLSAEWTPRAPHMSAGMAAALARDAGVKQFVLTHLPPHTPSEALLAEAREVFPETVLAVPGLCVAC